MTNRIYRALIASLGLVALALAANEASARAGSAAPARGAFAAMPRPPVAHSFRHHRGNRFFGGAFWPGDGFYGPVDGGGPIANVPPQSESTDVNYTYKNDVPWDWVHRFPPNVTPSDRPYVSSCPAETVTVPGRDGLDHTVNITRCY